MIIVMEYTDPTPETYTPAASVPRRVDVREDGSRYDARIINKSNDISPEENSIWAGVFTPRCRSEKPADYSLYVANKLTATRKALNEPLCSGIAAEKYAPLDRMLYLRKLSRDYTESSDVHARESLMQEMAKLATEIIDHVGVSDYEMLITEAERIDNMSLDDRLALQFSNQFEQDLNDLFVQNWML